MAPRIVSKRRFLALTAALALATGCDSGGEQPAEAPAKPAAAPEAPAEAKAETKPEATAKPEAAAPKARGKFVGTIGEDKVEMEVDCQHLDKPFFQFKSDKFDHKDTDGDGVVLSGMEHEGKFVLTYIVNDFNMSTPRLDEFEKSATGAQGSGTLRSEDAMQKKPVSFEVSCP